MVAARYNLGCSSDVGVESSVREKGERVWTTTDTAKVRRPQHSTFCPRLLPPASSSRMLDWHGRRLPCLPSLPKWRGSSGLPHRNGHRIRSPGGRSPPGTATSESAQAGRSCPETLDWLPFDSSSGNLLQAPAYQRCPHAPRCKATAPSQCLNFARQHISIQHCRQRPERHGLCWSTWRPPALCSPPSNRFGLCVFELTTCERAEPGKGARWD